MRAEGPGLRASRLESGVRGIIQTCFCEEKVRRDPLQKQKDDARTEEVGSGGLRLRGWGWQVRGLVEG